MTFMPCKFLNDEDAATAVEYAVMLALIIAVCIVGIQSFGAANSNLWADNDNGLQKAFNGS